MKATVKHSMLLKRDKGNIITYYLFITYYSNHNTIIRGQHNLGSVEFCGPAGTEAEEEKGECSFVLSPSPPLPPPP